MKKVTKGQNPKATPDEATVTKKPDGTTGMKLLHQEINWGNAPQLLMTMLSNINTNSLNASRDLAEIKELLKKNAIT